MHSLSLLPTPPYSYSITFRVHTNKDNWFPPNLA